MRWRNQPCEVLISDKAIYRTGRYLDFACSEQIVKDTELLSPDSPILKVYHGEHTSMSRAHPLFRQSILLPLPKKDGPVVKILVDELRKADSDSSQLFFRLASMGLDAWELTDDIITVTSDE